MARFSFRGALSSLDLALIARTEPTLVAMQERMVARLGFTPARAARVAESILGRVLLRYAEHLTAGKSALIDRVIALRTELDEAYHAAFTFNARATGTGGTASLDTRLRNIDTILAQLDDALEKLGRPMEEIDPPPGVGDALAPLHAEAAATPATPARPGTQRRTTADDTAPRPPSRPGGKARRSRVESGRYRFRRNADGSYTKVFDDGASATFHIENGRYRVEMFDPSGNRIGEAREYGVLMTPYGRKPRTTALIQAHHGFQDAIMDSLFGRFGYARDSAPSIWLRNSRHGSPHGVITAAQNGARATRGGSGVTLAQIRQWAIADLRLANMPDDAIAQYLRVFDDYFTRNVLPNIPARRRAALLGGWQPNQGLAGL